jgi:hypothetical protein
MEDYPLALIVGENSEDLLKSLKRIYITTLGAILEQKAICGPTWDEFKTFLRKNHSIEPQHLDTLIKDILSFTLAFEKNYNFHNNSVPNHLTTVYKKTFQIFSQHEYPFQRELKDLIRTKWVSLIAGRRSTGKATFTYQISIHHLIDLYFLQSNGDFNKQKVIFLETSSTIQLGRFLELGSEIIKTRLKALQKYTPNEAESILNFVLRNFETVRVCSLGDFDRALAEVKTRIKNGEILCQLFIVKDVSSLIELCKDVKLKKPFNGKIIND